MRLFIDPADAVLAEGLALDLPAGAARHAQVRRVQPGDRLWLFDGGGADWPALVLAVGRNSVRVELGAPQAVANEAARGVTLALGVPANERMDTLVEKATELGVAAIQPLQCERSVLVARGERAGRKQAHWQAVARAACEQCGRARVPRVSPMQAFAEWLATTSGPAASATGRAVLSLRADALPAAAWLAARPAGTPVLLLSGPEGGLSAAEEDAARGAGFAALSLGPRVLRADTAPLAALALAVLVR
jgi:16S rRNA (uracil1498-N3)-methyltransferase